MAWPPVAYPLGTSTGNATAAKDVHPALHNDAAQAINDIVDKINAGGGTSRVLVSGVALGTQAGGQGAFTYYAVATVAQRGLVSRFVVTPSDTGSYDIDIKAAADGSGEQFLAATGQVGAYDISWPWYFENNTDATFYVGVRNTALTSQTFTLTTLRVEKFA